VLGPFNAVTLESPAITEITLSGPGAGGKETASAVLGDLVSVMSSSGMELDPIAELEIVPGEQVESAFYLHLEVEDRPGVLGEIAKILGENGVSVKSVVQKELGEKARLVMVMHPVAEGRFNNALALISKLGFLRSAPRAIRVIEEEFVS
jgi:homoserine dehydrogenase